MNSEYYTLKGNVESLKETLNKINIQWEKLRKQEIDMQMKIFDIRDEFNNLNCNLKEAEYKLAKWVKDNGSFG